MDRFVRRVHNGTTFPRRVVLPKRIVQLWTMLFFQFIIIVERAPIIVIRYRYTLRLRRTIRTRAGFGQVLLMVGFRKVPQSTVLVVIGCRCDFRRDFAFPAQCFFVRVLGRFDQLLLFVIEIIKTGSVLCTTIVALSHPAARIVCFPKPTQDINEGNFFGVVHDSNAFRMPRPSAAGFFVRWIRCKTRAISDRGRMYPERQSPYTFFATPKTTVPKNGFLVSIGYIRQFVTQYVMPRAIDVGHFRRSAR